MRNSKAATPSDEVPAELEQRVDELMKPGDMITPASITEAPADRPPAGPIDASPKTAPEVPGQASDEPAETAEPASVPEADSDAAVTDAAEPSSEPSSAKTLDDSRTDAAVDEIAAQDGDKLLAAEDAVAQNGTVVITKQPFKDKLKRFFGHKRTWLGLLILLIVLAAVPWSRYRVAGLVLKKQLTVTVMDSKTATPVSNATVSFDGRSAETDASGRVRLKVPVSSSHLIITKQYYRSADQALTVGFSSPAQQTINLAATGRQVPLSVINKITGQPLAGVSIKILHTTAKTDARGRATVVLPANAATDKAALSAAGYNSVTLPIQVTSRTVSANSLAITPSGQIYFLSNLSGTIDVVKTNLDGTGRQTIYAGTGDESAYDTSLLASRDWQYLVLESQRSGSQPALYLIDTATDKVTEFDSSNASFTLLGWSGHDFLYDLVSNTIPQTQAGHEVIKSYDADNQRLNQLDGNQVQTNAAGSYGYQSFGNFYLINNLLVYSTEWYSYDLSGLIYDLSSLSDTIRTAQANGQGKKDVQSFSAASTNYIQAALTKPAVIDFSAYNGTTNQTTYYQYQNQAVTSISPPAQDTFYETYPTYLLSPAGDQTFWTELRDGQNSLFVGDQNAGDQKELASSGVYTPYGWYTDHYVLVSKNSSELYIMPAGGLKTGQTPLKITDYYKPSQSFNGYGGGYGGL